eukprot:jgi/Botrbrau1/6588/Bobra.0189s0015.1
MLTANLGLGPFWHRGHQRSLSDCGLDGSNIKRRTLNLSAESDSAIPVRSARIAVVSRTNHKDACTPSVILPPSTDAKTVSSKVQASESQERILQGACERSFLVKFSFVACFGSLFGAVGGTAPAAAHIPTEGFLRDTARPQTLDDLSRGFQPYTGPGRPYPVPPPRDRSPMGPSVREQAEQVMALTGQARAALQEGDYQQALERYTTITSQYGDLALADRARVSRALLLYQTGQVSQALLELEDEEVALTGNAEVHAALAALLWVERPSQRGRAETQWEIASEFDTRYSNVEWVQHEKGWPPRMLAALDRFLHVQ